MYFYEVLVSSPRFHGVEPLTYQSEKVLAAGAIVIAPLRAQEVVGVVTRSVSSPRFTTKPVKKVVVAQELPPELLALVQWLQTYYPAPLGIFGQLLLPSSLVRQRDLAALEPLPAAAADAALPPLARQQQEAFDRINTDKVHRTFVIHGDTGTGKTRLYIELARQTVAAGKSVLILTPEIGLTPQLQHRLAESVAAPVIVVHSHLTPAERRTVWLRILQATSPIVVLGPRSALFTPLKKLGLLIIDEAHDGAYKQEQAPHYQSLRVAAQLAKLHKARYIIGTATPSVTDYFIAEQTKTPIIRLTDRPAGDQTDKHITVVNLRDRTQFPGQPHLSQPLVETIEAALGRHEQSLVFLNRRGTARLILCQACGWQALCPKCDVPLTYHGDSHNMRCHMCGYRAPVPTSCPECQASEILFKSVGTKSIVTELQKVFPQAVIKRFDTDNHKTERLEEQYADIAGGKVDILVGTQLLAKGLDLPKLSVVGVIAADTSLSFPDYTAEEHTFQLLTQIIGRVGRGHSHGQVVIQTYNPEGLAIRTAVKQDWPAFYKEQLQERQRFGFPPYYHLLKIHCSRASRASAQAAAERLASHLRQADLRIDVVGPAPSFYEKAAGAYRWQLLVKAKARSELLKTVAALPAGWSYDLDPANLL